MLNAVLNILNGDERVLDLGLEIRRYLEGEEVDGGGVILLLLRLKRLFNGFGDLVDVEVALIGWRILPESGRFFRLSLRPGTCSPFPFDLYFIRVKT